MSGMERYQIILEKVPEEARPAAALFLSGCFSLPPSSTRDIAASSPIALISDMTKRQAEAVLAELSPTQPEGVSLKLVPERAAAKISRLQWPRPPRIYGSDLAAFVGGRSRHDLKCPICGGCVRVTVEDDGEARIAALDEPGDKSGGDTAAMPPGEPTPLFSGVKPLGFDSSHYASLRSLEAGDTGFWTDSHESIYERPPANQLPEPEKRSGSESTHGGKKSSFRGTAGLAAFMKSGAYAVVLGRTRDNQAVKMVADIMGISVDEAREKCLNLGLCVARDISLDEAQTLLARFQGVGARARIVKPI